MDKKDRVIIALDVNNFSDAKNLVAKLQGQVSVFKVGMELYTACGQEVVQYIHDSGAKVFLDLKFHDIPNTVASVCKVATQLGVFMFNVHTSGGSEMMKWASEAVREESSRLEIEKPILIGVTMLTSLDQAQIDEVGFSRSIPEQVKSLALLAKQSGLDGVVSSPLEIKTIKEVAGNDFQVVTPGIRPEWFVGKGKNDQKRVMTPNKAFAAGADYIVIGRPVARDDEPDKAMEKVIQEIN